MQGVRVCCFLSTLLLAITACTSRSVREPPPTNATLAANGIECHKERTTGSLVAAKVCTSAEERARQADAVQKTKDWMDNASAGPCPPSVQCH